LYLPGVQKDLLPNGSAYSRLFPEYSDRYIRLTCWRLVGTVSALQGMIILIRISLNCGTEETYSRFHGYPKGWDYVDRIKLKMRELVRRKLERAARTLVGISLIVDERNMDDVVVASKQIRAVVDEAGDGIDYVIVRPAFNYDTSRHVSLGVETKRRAIEHVDEGGPVREILDGLGIPLVLIKDSFAAAPSNESYQGYGVSCLRDVRPDSTQWRRAIMLRLLRKP
jgi:hypothetical protein